MAWGDKESSSDEDTWEEHGPSVKSVEEGEPRRFLSSQKSHSMGLEWGDARAPNAPGLVASESDTEEDIPGEGDESDDGVSSAHHGTQSAMISASPEVLARFWEYFLYLLC